MNGEQTLNLNSAECIKRWSDFGMDHYQNICSGKLWDVPWGSSDWAIVVLLMVGLVIFLGFVALILFRIAFGRY